jgi:hypothetical protein
VHALRSRWQALDRGTRLTFVALTTLTAGAIGVRAWLMVSYSPAFLGYPDSSQYALAAAFNIFRDPQRPAGYALFLRLVHHLSDEVSVTIAVQHTLGIATGLLLYKAVRRTGAPAWLGLFPAAIAFFDGTGLIMEHALLADSLLTFLQALVIYLAIRALYEPTLRWWLLTGAAIGVSFWVKTVAISSAIVIPVVLLRGVAGSARRRLVSALTVLVAAAALICVYVGAQYLATGYLGYQRQNAWNLYGRVATFVNCAHFTAPRGTRFLCPREPVGDRQPPSYYQGAPNAPAVERFGPPWEAPAEANAVLERFSVAVIEQEPVAYAEAIMRGFGRYVFPRAGEGATPAEDREAVVSAKNVRYFQPDFGPLYPHSQGYAGSQASIAPLAIYESDTRVEGPVLILLLAAAIAGPFFLPRRLRWAAAIFTLTALFTILFAVAGSGYDARYAYPTFGPLAGGAALGAWGIWSRLARVMLTYRRAHAGAESAGIHSR